MYFEEESKYDLDKYDYIRQMGAYKPHFQGISQSYYPLNGVQILKTVLILVIAIGFSLTLLIVFQFWVVSRGLQSYIITWVSILLIFVILSIIFLYKGGKDRRVLQKAMIKQNTKKEKQMIKIK